MGVTRANHFLFMEENKGMRGEPYPEPTTFFLWKQKRDEE
jgi:hypothetical protein